MPITIPENFYKETIAQDWPTGLGSFYLSTKPTITAGRLVISPSSSTLREIIAYTSCGTDGTGDFVVVSERGIGGTTEQTHVIGETVRNNVTAETIQEISDALSAIGAPTTGTTAPSSTPTAVGQLYIDTTNKNVYIAVGTSSSADWSLIAII